MGMIFVSVVLLIAAVASLLYQYTPNPNQYLKLQVVAWGNMSVNAYGLNGPSQRDLNPNVAAHPDGKKSSTYTVADHPIALMPDQVFPYSWLTLPLATSGIIALVSGVYVHRKGAWMRVTNDRERLRYWSSWQRGIGKNSFNAERIKSQNA